MDNRLRLIEVFTYLWEKTDVNNHATIVDIQKYLEEKNMKSTRQTITEDLLLLQSTGWFDLVCERKTQNHYYISKRFFEEADVKVICDAVRSSYFISNKNSKELISTLKTFVGPSLKKNLDSPSFIDASVKTKNNDVIKNANKISKAIINQKQITFRYFDYDADKNKVYKHNKKYVVSPYAMVINDGKYYIAAYEEEGSKVKTFRIDKIDKLSVLGIKNYPQPKDFSVSKFESQTDMYGGKEIKVELLCHMEVMYGVIDKFGNNVTTQIVDPEHFKAYVSADLSPTFMGWIVGFGGKIQIVGPQSSVKEFNDLLSGIIAKN